MGVLGITSIISYGTTEYLFGVLIVPFTSTFSWSRASLSGAYALGLVLSGVLGVPIGYMVDRWGTRWLMTGGSVLAGFVLIALSHVTSLWQLYALWSGGIGLTMALTLYPVSFVVATNWFVRRRGTALAVLTFLGGLASPIFVHSPGCLWRIWDGTWLLWRLVCFISSFHRHCMPSCCAAAQRTLVSLLMEGLPCRSPPQFRSPG